MVDRARKNVVLIVAAALLIAVAETVADAGPILDFNSPSLAVGATIAQLNAYMTGLYGNTVTVSTAVVSTPNGNMQSGAVVSHAYTGDGHAVGTCSPGPCVSGSAASLLTPTTLGTTQAGGAGDNFLTTTGTNTVIDIMFAGGGFTSIAFDYEIFPSAGGSPDFTFVGLMNATNIYQSATIVGITPVNGFSCAGTNNTGSTANSVAPCVPYAETNRQLGPQTMTAVFASPVNHLQFIDWPDTIGIDNIQFNPPSGSGPGPVPEPASMVLLGSGLVGLVATLRRKARVGI